MRFHLQAYALLICLALCANTAANEETVSTQVISLDGTWLLATDSENVGRQRQWFQTPRPEAKQTRVPWIIQEAFPGYHGVAWYWRAFTPPANPHVQGRYLLKFWAVDYLAEVWLNGVPVGGHEGGEGPFVLDVTAAIKPGKENLLAVRVLNPTNEPIDDIALPFIPRRCKVVPFRAGALYNDGGIVDSVELLIAPPVRVTDLWVRPDPNTGKIRVRTTLHNALDKPAAGHIELTVGAAANGPTLQAVRLDRPVPPGPTAIDATLQVDQPRLWELNDPNLYRVTARVSTEGSASFDEVSTRCGFRDFRFADGHFRLNGRRIFLKCSHTSTHYPIGLHWPHDPDLARRDLLLAKAMGFNSIRFFCSVPTRYQLELCDEIGLMIYEESFAGWFLEPSPKMGERFDREISEMILRDRNHPCVIMWGLLNEMGDVPVFRHAVNALPLVRALDDTRVVMLNSGRFDSVTGGSSPVGISFWMPSTGREPCINFNGTNGPVSALGIVWEPGQLALHPGPRNEFSVLRWTAPAAGEYAVSAKFASIAERATTDVHVLHAGKPLLKGFINLNDQGRELAWSKTIAMQVGETLDFAVGSGNANYGGDNTGLTLTIRHPDGTIDNPAAQFSIEKNPSGRWTYGFAPAGEVPDATKLTAYPKGETFGGGKQPGAIGSLSNPGSTVWEDVVADLHPYKGVPHTAQIIRELRTATGGSNPVFASEYGIGSGVDLAQTCRHFEQLGAEKLEDAQWYRQRLDMFMADWKRWNMDDTFAGPRDFFSQSLAKMGKQRLLGLNAIRANPNMVGHSMTGTVDQANCGEGLFTTFRDLKPGTVDAVFDGWYPLRWCLFVEPVNVYRNTSVRLEAVLANEDMLRPGEYPVRLQVVGPGTTQAFDKTITVKIPDPGAKPATPFATLVFAEDVKIDGPAGQYRFLATFQRGAAAAGGEVEFYVADPAQWPKVETEVVLWGEDAELAQWLAARGIRTRPFAPNPPNAREVILASATPPAPGGAAAFAELARRIARGSAVVFLSPAVFAKADNRVGWLPLANKGALVGLPSWLYHKDEWAKRHPIFDGLPAGGLMDYTFYRELILDIAFTGQDVPAEIVAGATNTSIDYSAGLTVSVHKLGAGKFTLNTLRIRENLGRNPAADRLLLNMLRHAARDAGNPPVELPADFDAQLKTLGY